MTATDASGSASTASQDANVTHGELYEEYVRIFGEHENAVLTKLARDARLLMPRPPAIDPLTTTTAATLRHTAG